MQNTQQALQLAATVISSSVEIQQETMPDEESLSVSLLDIYS